VEFVCEVFADSHDASAFNSGKSALDDWLRKSVRDSDGRNLTRTYGWRRGAEIVVAYYTLMPYFLERGTLGTKQARGLPNRIPCYLLGRLALDDHLHGQRLGLQLLASALARVAAGSRELGGRYALVDAIDDAANVFYRHHGFAPVPGHEGRLILSTEVLHPYLES
jgi:GNAT superfamily N-acetyltransferase